MTPVDVEEWLRWSLTTRYFSLCVSVGPVGEVIDQTIDVAEQNLEPSITKNVTIASLDTVLDVLTSLRCFSGRYGCDLDL
jgi:hypothetical protein